MPRPSSHSSRNRPRDTATAVRALELAHAYLREVADAISSIAGDPARTTTALNDIALASKELSKAARADPTATLAIDVEDGSVHVFTLAKLKTLALLYEGLCRSIDDPRRALRILDQATTIAPDAAEVNYWIGVLATDLCLRGRAVAALDKAVALDPGNLEYRKALGRAGNLSGAQVAFERTAAGVSRTVTFFRWTVIAIIAIVLISIVANLADPATRGGTILAILGVAIAIGLLTESIKIVWGDITGRNRRP